MSKVFLIDTENISDYSFLNDYLLTPEDKIVLFISKNSKRITLNDFSLLHQCNAKIVEEHIEVGTPNALDFQLITYAALFFNEVNEYYIVSDDCGYEVFCRYMQTKICTEIKIIKTKHKIGSESTANNYSIKDIINEENKELQPPTLDMKDIVDKQISTLKN